jgi:hypothetical protein
MCGDDPDPTPEVNDDDVKGEHALYKGVPKSDGEGTLKEAPPEQLYLEEFGSRTFVEVFNQFNGVGNTVVPSSVDDAWRRIGNQLHSSANTFEQAVTRLKGAGGWEGKTIESAYDNAVKSVKEPFHAGTAALRGAEMVHKFRDTMDYVVNNLVHDVGGSPHFNTLLERYHYDLAPKSSGGGYNPYAGGASAPTVTTPNAKQIEEHYNSYMRTIMNQSYKPGLSDVNNAYPQFANDTTPALGNTPQIPGTDLGKKPGPGVGPGTGSGTPSFGGGGKPSIPGKPATTLTPLKPEWQQEKPDSPNRPGDPDKPPTDRPTTPDDSLPEQPTGIGQGLSQLPSAATQAASSLGGLGKAPTVPEGMLNLGKGAEAMKAAEALKAAGRGSGGGGAGGGASLGGPKDLPSRMAGQMTQASGATPAGQASAARSGIGSSAPGAGAPAAGSRGGGNDGKEHKTNKALRTRKNGTEIAGQDDAVVAVLGQEGEDEGKGQRPPANG